MSAEDRIRSIIAPAVQEALRRELHPEEYGWPLYERKDLPARRMRKLERGERLPKLDPKHKVAVYLTVALVLKKLARDLIRETTQKAFRARAGSWIARAREKVK